MSGADLIFHETGHLILMSFSETVHFIGGTIGQLFFPILFFKKKRIFLWHDYTIVVRQKLNQYCNIHVRFKISNNPSSRRF